jgi:hypothetical protein
MKVAGRHMDFGEARGVMNFSKRNLFGNLPEDDEVRAELACLVEASFEAFTIRAHPRPRKPKRNLTGSPRDTVWERALPAAIRELGIHHRNINGVPHFRTAADRDSS